MHTKNQNLQPQYLTHPRRWEINWKVVYHYSTVLCLYFFFPSFEPPNIQKQQKSRRLHMHLLRVRLMEYNTIQIINTHYNYQYNNGQPHTIKFITSISGSCPINCKVEVTSQKICVQLRSSEQINCLIHISHEIITKTC